MSSRRHWSERVRDILDAQPLATYPGGCQGRRGRHALLAAFTELDH